MTDDSLRMPVPATRTRGLTLAHVVTALAAEHPSALGLGDILLVRHVLDPKIPGQLHGEEDLTEERVLSHTRRQRASGFANRHMRYWLVFISDGSARSRLWGVYENGGPVASEGDDEWQYFDLRRSDFLASMTGRLVIEWSFRGFYGYAGANAANMPVLEIADRDKEPFPGFDNVLLTYQQLREMVESPRYADWRVALAKVQGIYLITDSENGKQYVGKADGAEMILQRWKAYASDGHGGNVALRALAKRSAAAGGAPRDHARHFLFSLLRVFGPSTSSSEVNAAEEHYKRALRTRETGLNKN